jgi:hypothetical protein
MKFKDIYTSLLIEQLPPEDNDLNTLDTDGLEEPVQPAQPEEPEQPEEPTQEKPKKEKPLSATQKLKLKWKEENPGLTEQAMAGAIDFFNRRKNGMIEYKEPGYINPLTGRRHVNLPEIAAMANRFPEMFSILSDHSKIRDIQNYTWEQMEYFMDRVNTQQTNIDLNIKIEGDTLELQKASAYKIWENARNKVVNENNFMAIRVESKPESIALGHLQHILNDEETEREKEKTGRDYVHINNNWCITWGTNEGSNMYYDYRNRRSYYFILDKNKQENDLYYLSVLQPIKPGHSEYPYVITLRNNMDEKYRVHWEEVISIWPTLRGKEEIFRYFPLTIKETNDITVDKINFTPHTTDRPNPYYFAIQDLRMQRRYIESNRYINDVKSFDVLPAPEKKLYVAMTKIEGSDYKKRFRCNDPSNPLGILNLIYDTPGGLYRYLDEFVLKERLKLPGGVHSLKVGIVGMELKPLYSTIDEKFTLYQQRQNNLIGVMNIETLDMIKPMSYIHTITQMVFDVEKNKPYLMYRYSEKHPGQDYFYFLIPLQNLTGNKKSEHYMKGFFFEKEKGDELFTSGRLKKIKGY